MKFKKTIIVLNGIFDDNLVSYKNIIFEEPYFYIAVDGGSRLFKSLNILPNLIIGDLDSLDSEILDYYKKKNVDILKYSTKKDASDGELAIKYCFDNNFEDIVITGSIGGRLDQQFANINLLEYAQINNLKAIIKEPGIEVGLIDGYKEYHANRNNILSLISLDYKTTGISNFGFEYPLNNETLYRFNSRGISNIINTNKAWIKIEKGRLLYILSNNHNHPD